MSEDHHMTKLLGHIALIWAIISLPISYYLFVVFSHGGDWVGGGESPIPPEMNYVFVPAVLSIFCGLIVMIIGILKKLLGVIGEGVFAIISGIGQFFFYSFAIAMMHIS